MCGCYVCVYMCICIYTQPHSLQAKLTRLNYVLLLREEWFFRTERECWTNMFKISFGEIPNLFNFPCNSVVKNFWRGLDGSFPHHHPTLPKDVYNYMLQAMRNKGRWDFTKYNHQINFLSLFTYLSVDVMQTYTRDSSFVLYQLLFL